MAEITEFSAIDELESKKIALKNCIAQNSSGDSCSKCQRVFGCDRIKEFVILQFDIATARLKDCQKANNLSSCMDCDRIFECDIRENYVKSSYEKMNEGRGGQFDF